MFVEMSKRLPNGCVLHCFACRKNQASHLCRIGWDETTIKACLCNDCQQMEYLELIESVLGMRKKKVYLCGFAGQVTDTSDGSLFSSVFEAVEF